MRIFISTFLTIGFLLAPSCVWAQNTHPNAVPPTKAPTTPLPVVSLDGTVASPSATNTTPSATATNEPVPQATQNSSLFMVLTGGAVVIIAGWYLWRRKH